MADKLRNIIEDIAVDFLNSALTTRIDICTCSKCKNDMLAYVLSRVPAKYVTTEFGALHTIIEQTKLEKEAEVGRATIAAIDIISKSPRHEVKENKEATFQLLLDKIYQDRGLDFRHYHSDLIKRRIAMRMNLNKVSSLSEYLMYLINNPHEYDKLFEVLCINVSEFFRDPPVWETMTPIIKDLILQKNGKPGEKLNIWSAACAYGEEPYSIAILLKELLKQTGATVGLEINATDLDPKALRASHKADYPKTAVKNVKSEYLKAYFTAQLNSLKLKDEIKDMVSFKPLDLIASDYIKNTDIIFCRNVFIYFTRSLQDQLLMKFFHSLKTGGYLVMGITETMWPEAKEIFEEVSANCRIYRKRAVT